MQRIPPTALVPARLELHYAAQVVSACADAWLPKRVDDGHTSMRWANASLIGEPTGGGISLGVRTTDFTLLAIHPGRTATFTLTGATLADAMAWADGQLGPPRGVHMRDYD